MGKNYRENKKTFTERMTCMVMSRIHTFNNPRMNHCNNTHSDELQTTQTHDQN